LVTRGQSSRLVQFRESELRIRHSRDPKKEVPLSIYASDGYFDELYSSVKNPRALTMTSNHQYLVRGVATKEKDTGDGVLNRAVLFFQGLEESGGASTLAGRHVSRLWMKLGTRTTQGFAIPINTPSYTLRHCCQHGLMLSLTTVQGSSTPCSSSIRAKKAIRPSDLHYHDLGH
jgi:hypothetical protein